MLSKKADQFIIELKMYLMSKGKNDEEINGVTEELKDHLIQAEAEGKSIKDITGDSPRAYMKSIGQEMGFDVRQFITLVPMTALLLVAYFCFTPAILGEFSLSKIGVWGAVIGTIISLFLYGFLLVNVLPKLFYSKTFYIILGLTYIFLTGFFVIVLLLDKGDAFFIATPLQNNLILIACIATFIIWAIYSKTWFTIIIPLFMSMGPLAIRFVPEHINEDPFYITIAIIIISIITIGVIYFLVRKGKTQS